MSSPAQGVCAAGGAGEATWRGAAAAVPCSLLHSSMLLGSCEGLAMLQMAVGEGQEGFNHTHHNITASLMHAPPPPLSSPLKGAAGLGCIHTLLPLPPPCPPSTPPTHLPGAVSKG